MQCEEADEDAGSPITKPQPRHFLLPNIKKMRMAPFTKKQEDEKTHQILDVLLVLGSSHGDNRQSPVHLDGRHPDSGGSGERHGSSDRSSKHGSGSHRRRHAEGGHCERKSPRTEHQNQREAAQIEAGRARRGALERGIAGRKLFAATNLQVSNANSRVWWTEQPQLHSGWAADGELTDRTRALFAGAEGKFNRVCPSNLSAPNLSARKKLLTSGRHRLPLCVRSRF